MLERFLSKVKVPRDLSGCWEWQGTKETSGHPYGRFRVKSGWKRAHRISYELFHGHPAKLHVLHSCDNPGCVSPLHLREGTHAENIQESADKKRHNQARKTHCPQGHAYTKENLVNCKYGKRRCKTCLRNHARSQRGR